MHTQWSDGSASILEMAQAAKERKYEYMAITDHSKGLKIANGIDEKALAEQALEIAEANAAMRAGGVTVLRSIEMNLNPRGQGDMDSEVTRAQTVISPRYEILKSKFLVIREGAFTIIALD